MHFSSLRQERKSGFTTSTFSQRCFPDNHTWRSSGIIVRDSFGRTRCSWVQLLVRYGEVASQEQGPRHVNMFARDTSLRKRAGVSRVPHKWHRVRRKETAAAVHSTARCWGRMHACCMKRHLQETTTDRVKFQGQGSLLCAAE